MPGRLRKADERWEVMPFTRGAAESLAPELDGKQYSWKRWGAFHMKDGGAAQALEQKYEGQLLAVPISSPDVHDRGHRYFFGGWPEMPWKRKVNDERIAKICDGQEQEPQESPGQDADEGQAHDARDGRGRYGTQA